MIRRALHGVPLLTRNAPTAPTGPLATRGVTVDPTSGAFNRGYSLMEMVGIINRTPPAPSEIGRRLPWTPKPVSQRTISFEDYGHKLEPVEPKTWGGAPQVKGKPKRSMLPLDVYHHPLQSTLSASEIQGKRAIGTEVTPETVEAAVQDITQQHTQDHELTWEKDRALSLRGQIPLPGGGFVDLFDALKSKKTEVNINLGQNGLSLRKEFTKLKRTVEKILSNQYRIRGFEAIHGSDAFDGVTNHASFEKIVERQDGTGQPLRDDLRGGYSFLQNVTLSSYDYADYVPGNKMLFCPIIDNFYFDFFAPMDHFLTVNRLGLPFYANAWMHPNGKDMTIDSESNAIHLAAVPEAIIEVTFTNIPN